MCDSAMIDDPEKTKPIIDYFEELGFIKQADTIGDLAKQIADLGEYNPHDNPHGRYNCNECHKAHSPQVNRCDFCHDNGAQEMLY